MYSYDTTIGDKGHFFADETTYAWHAGTGVMAGAGLASTQWLNALIYKNGVYVNTARNTPYHTVPKVVYCQLEGTMSAADTGRLGYDRSYHNFTGMLCELICFSSALSTAEIAESTAALSQKWSALLS